MVYPDLPTPLVPVYIPTYTFISSPFLKLNDVNHIVVFLSVLTH